MTLGSIVQWLALQGHKQKVASSSPTRRKLCQDQFGNDLREDFHLDQEWIHTEECSHRHSHEAGDDQKRRNPSRNDVNIEGARCNQDKGRLTILRCPKMESGSRGRRKMVDLYS